MLQAGRSLVRFQMMLMEFFIDLNSGRTMGLGFTQPPIEMSKGKGKFHPRTDHEGPEGEERYSSTLSLTSVLDGVGGQLHAPATLPPVKTRYPLYRRLGGPQGRSGRVRKTSSPPGFDPRTVQPVAKRYTDCAIPVLQYK